MNTVTIGLEEYLELRKLRDVVGKGSCTVYVLDRFSKDFDFFRYSIYTEDEAVKDLLETNKNLSDAIVAQSKLIKPIKRKWWHF